MKKLYGMAFCLLLVSSYGTPGINFGGPNSGFILVDGNLDVGTADLEGGLIRDLTGNGFISTGAVCDNMTFEVADNTGHRSLHVTGTVNPGISIVLDEYDILTLNGGRCDEQVTANGSGAYPSVIRGYGEFSNNILISNNSSLLIGLTGQLNQMIEMTASNAASEEMIDEVPVTPADTCELELEQDLVFTSGRFITTSGSGDCWVNCGGYKIFFGGDEDSSLYINRPLHVSNTYLELTGPVELEAGLYLDEGVLSGNGNLIRFFDVGSSYGFLQVSGGDLDVKNVRFEDVRPNSFYGENSDEFNLHNCVITCDNFAWNFPVDAEDPDSVVLTVDVESSSFNITGELHDDRSDFFVGDVELDDANSEDIFVSLNKKLTINGEWLLTADATFRGNGNDLVFGKIFQPAGEDVALYRQGALWVRGASENPYVLRFEDITLRDVNAAAFKTNSLLVSIEDMEWTETGWRELDLYNVNWIDDSGQHIFITGHGTGAARVELPEDAAEAGDLFGSDITFETGTHIELRSDITLNATWTFTEDSVVQGCGASLDLGAASLAVATGKTLTLCNMTIVGANSASFINAGETMGTFILSNVTIVLAEDTAWGSDITVTGPLTVVTGDDHLVANNMVIEYGTAYYDTLDADDDTNFTVDTGRVMRISAAIGGGGDTYDPETTGTITINGNASLEKNEYLFPYDDLDGRTISCVGSGVYNGHGRTLFFPYSAGFGDGSAVVLAVDADQSLVTTNMILDGLVPAQHLQFGGSLYFGHDTLVRLNQDVVLEGVLRFGSQDELSSDETMILDLQGHDLNLGTGWIELYGGSTDNNTLIIKNGRILVTDTDLLVVATGNTLVFENVDIVFMGTDWIHETGNLRFEGHCRFMGDAGNSIFCRSSGSTLIADAATLTLCDGIVWSHSTTQDFLFGSSTATLELIGATFRHPDFVYNTERAFVAAGQLSFSLGKLICDHKSYIQPGEGGITIADSLTIELRPGATIIINEALFESSEDASAGTLTYGAGGGGGA